MRYISTSFCVDDVWYTFHPDLMPQSMRGDLNRNILAHFRELGYKFDRKEGEHVLVDDPSRPELNLAPMFA